MASSETLAFDGPLAQALRRQRDPALVVAADIRRAGNPKILFANDAFCRLHDQTGGDLVGQPIDVLFGPNGDHHGLRKITWAVAGRRPCEFEAEVYRRDGSSFVSELSVTPVLNDDETALCFVVSERDITERRRAEILAAGQTKILERVAARAPLSETLRQLAKMVELMSADYLVAIRVLDDEGNDLVRVATEPLMSKWTDNSGRTPRLEAFPVKQESRRAGIYIHREMHDIAYLPSGDELREEGVRRAWVKPVVSAAGAVNGVFALLAKHDREPNDHELDLIELASHLTAVAIESKSGERALGRSEERFRDVVEAVSDWIWETNAEHRLTFVSPGQEDLLGHAPSDLLGKRVMRFVRPAVGRGPAIDPDTHQSFKDVFLEVDDTNGNTHRIRVSGRPVFAADGSFAGYRGAASDVTHEEEVAALARLATERLNMAVESIDQGFLLFDADDRLVICNSRAGEIVPEIADLLKPGISFTEIVRAGIARDVYDLPAERRRTALAARLERHHSPRGPFEIPLRDSRWLRVDERTTRDGGVVAVWTDITEAKRREVALHEAKDAAELASRSKSEFLANISHELRTPLNAIIGFAEVMDKELFGMLGNDHYRDYVRDISDSGRHLLQLINDLLDVSKIEVGRLEVEDSDLQIAGVVETCVRMVRERARNADVGLKVDVAPDLPTIRADERKLKQIVLNLLSNAVKFTPAGGHIWASAMANADGGVTIIVKDDGIGIAADDIPEALNVFGQIDGSLSRKYEGAGLGLPLSKALTELHGGQLDIHSVIGSGTEVFVHLPADRVVGEAVAAQ